MNCKIIWNELSLPEWEERFARVKRSNILQSYRYAQAASTLQKQKARWGLILINDQEAGLVQLLEAGILWNLFHAVVLDRGPLWFDGYGGAAHIKMFFDELNAQLPVRFGRKRRILPEVQDGMTAQSLLKQTGMTRVAEEPGYKTLWWDLTLDEETARQKLNTKWRGHLNKAERADLTVQWDETGKFYPWLRAVYAADKAVRGYNGPSPQLLDNLARFSTQDHPMIIGKVQKDGEDIAAVMFLKHGQSATYQVGWSSEEGRKNAAHQLLLWQGRNILKTRGVTALDLGGINDQTAGINTFKEGTGAEPCTLVGRYI